MKESQCGDIERELHCAVNAFPFGRAVLPLPPGFHPPSQDKAIFSNVLSSYMPASGHVLFVRVVRLISLPQAL